MCNCFPAGAKVATATGATPIQRIRVGDRVWARDLASGRSELRRVSGLFHKQATRLLAITVAGTSIQVTPEHPFWSPGKGWVLAGHLRTGDRLLARDGRTVTIAKIASRAVKVTVYNFEVEGDHNYYISTAQLLVHNCAMRAGGGGGAGEVGQVSYGSTDLSLAAQAARRGAQNFSSKRNVSVFEFETEKGVGRIARFNEIRGRHSEEVIADELPGLGVQPGQVNRILRAAAMPSAQTSVR